MAKWNKRGHPPVYLERLPEGAQNFIIENNIILKKNIFNDCKTTKYNMKRWLLFYDGYDFLQNLIVVRRYICSRYKINNHLFELLLYLFPIQYFTREDYKKFPSQFTYRQIDKLIDLGLVSIASMGANKDEHLYTLNRSGKSIVIMTYKCLSGEKKMSEKPELNSLASSDANKFEKKHMDLIKHLNQLEVPQTKKRFYE